MSSLGKILAFVNVVLAGLFLGWAARALNENSDWKVKHDQVTTRLETERDTLKKDLAAANADRANLQGQLGSVSAARDGFEADKNRLTAENARLDQNLAKWAADLNSLSSTHQSVVEARTKLQEEKDKAVQAQHDAEAAKLAAEAAQMAAEKTLGEETTKGVERDAQIAQLEKDKTSLTKEKGKVETDLASLQAYTGASLEAIMSLPQIDGKVLAVAMDVKPGLISINKGKADGVQRGFTFQVFDGNKFKGTARVEFVHDTMCSAILTNVVEGVTIRQGDSASTRL